MECILAVVFTSPSTCANIKLYAFFQMNDLFASSSSAADPDEDLDMDYLDDHMSSFVDGLFKNMAVLAFKKDDIDMRVMMVDTDDVVDFVEMGIFSSVDNLTYRKAVKNPISDPRCPYFMIIMQDHKAHKELVNYHFKTFLYQTGLWSPDLDGCCGSALVVGMAMTEDSDDWIQVSIPADYHAIPIGINYSHSPIEKNWDPSKIPEIWEQLSSMDEEERSRFQYDIVRDYHAKPIIQGMGFLSSYLPDELHWHVIKYLRSPTGELIHNHMETVKAMVAYWNRHFRNVLFSPGPW